MQLEETKILKNICSNIWAQLGLFSRFSIFYFFGKNFNFFVIFQIAGVELAGSYPSVSPSPARTPEAQIMNFGKLFAQLARLVL